MSKCLDVLSYLATSQSKVLMAEIIFVYLMFIGPCIIVIVEE